MIFDKKTELLVPCAPNLHFKFILGSKENENHRLVAIRLHHWQQLFAKPSQRSATAPMLHK
jgi:hypothetical protein